MQFLILWVFIGCFLNVLMLIKDDGSARSVSFLIAVSINIMFSVPILCYNIHKNFQKPSASKSEPLS